MQIFPNPFPLRAEIYDGTQDSQLLIYIPCIILSLWRRQGLWICWDATPLIKLHYMAKSGTWQIKWRFLIGLNWLKKVILLGGPDLIREALFKRERFSLAALKKQAAIKFYDSSANNHMSLEKDPKLQMKSHPKWHPLVNLGRSWAEDSAMLYLHSWPYGIHEIIKGFKL